jgi:hypothetical protein
VAIQLADYITKLRTMLWLLHRAPLLLRGGLAAGRIPPAAANSQLCCLRQFHCMRHSATAPCDAAAYSSHSLIASGRHPRSAVAHQHRLQRQQHPRRWHCLQSSASAAADPLVGDAASPEHTANKPRCSPGRPHGGSWHRQAGSAGSWHCQLARELTPHSRRYPPAVYTPPAALLHAG